MRTKIKLINICIRHKCSASEGPRKVAKKFAVKIIRKAQKNEKPGEEKIDITSKSQQTEAHIGSDLSRPDTNFCKDFSDDAGMRMLHRARPLLRYNGPGKKTDSQENAEKEPVEKSVPETTEPPQAAEEKESEVDDNAETRFNRLNMQMLSRRLYEQVFPSGGGGGEEKLTEERLKILRTELDTAGTKMEERNVYPDVRVNLPALEGKDVEEHFFNLAKQQTQPYNKIIDELLGEIPEMPEQWLMQEGWTRYSNNGTERVDHPLEDGTIFDVEVCMKEGALPTLATAVSREAWYCWVSKSLMAGRSVPLETRWPSTDLLIPMESLPAEHGEKLSSRHKKAKIIVGHNVSFDRQRIKEQYWLHSTGTRFIDTMSMHVCISGLNSFQRTMLKVGKRRQEEGKVQKEKPDWEGVSSLNNLSDVYELYCGGEERLDKDPRNVFVEGSLQEIANDFQKLVQYCAKDVVATHRIYRQLIPMFRERFPHPVTLGGMLELGIAYLPVNSNWTRYIEESESSFDDLKYEANKSLAKRADDACKLLHNEHYKNDWWMWDEDWSVQGIKVKAKLPGGKKKSGEPEIKEDPTVSESPKYLSDGEEEEVDPLERDLEYLQETRKLLPAKLPHMPGYPAWYRKLCSKPREADWAPGPHKIGTSMRVAPKLLNLTWENYPLHHTREHGWGFLVSEPKKSESSHPRSSDDEQADEIGRLMSSLGTEVQEDATSRKFWSNEASNRKYWSDQAETPIIIDAFGARHRFYKLPHKDGPAFNVGNPLARDFLNKLSENVLAGSDPSATQVLKIARNVSYWRNNRERIMSQMVVWLKDKKGTGHRGMRQGAIIPQVVVCGTLTRRATEATWMTATNASAERVGSELRSMIQAPPGYSFVGADVDSQELWIASVMGDAAHAGRHGSTPLGRMTLVGSKANGTDMHSVTAKAVGITRDHAKVINYARIYGAGQKFAERLLKRFNPTMSESEAKTKSRKMFALTKGKRVYRLQPEFVNRDTPDCNYTAWEARGLAQAHGKTQLEMFGKPKWRGGSESAMFNRLEEIAGAEYPVTPFLNSRLSRALEKGDGADGDKYLPTKINWVVQSGAVDFLHLMLVSMRWLMGERARFCLSFHDEIRYIVPWKYRYNAALAMHVTNLLTRSFCSSRLGIRDLPMSVAFFGSVEVDTVLRKESSLDCKTPSNPHGLENGYGIPAGESLNIEEALAKSGGSLGAWHALKSANDSTNSMLQLQIHKDAMSEATKRKHVTKQLCEDVLRIPSEVQSIVKLVDSRGNNLHEVEDAQGQFYLVSMPVKFRKSVWVKRGNFLLVEPIPEGDKVKAEIVQILTKDHINFYKSEGCWPQHFTEERIETCNDDGEEALFENTNRRVCLTPQTSDSE